MPTTDSAEEMNEIRETKENSTPKKEGAREIAFEILKRGWPPLLALAMMIGLYWETISYWYRKWMMQQSYYSHGPLVVPIALFMVWSIRSMLAKTPAKPTLWGLALILPMIPVYMIGRVYGAGTFSMLAFMVMLIGCILLVFGKNLTRLLLFPTLFLISMIPLPGLILDDITGPVQRTSTVVAAMVLKLIYPETVRQEMDIIMPSWSFVVGVPCSGFKLLISLLTFTAFFAYMLKGELWRKVALFIFSGPFAIAINVLRVVMIGLVGEWFGEEAGHSFHDYSGYISLVVAFVILFKVAKWFGCRDFADTAFTPTPGGLFPPATGRPVFWRNSFVLIGIFAVVFGLNQMMPPVERTVTKAKINRSEFPPVFAGWVQNGEDREPDEMTKQELHTADIISREYRDENGYSVDFLNVAGIDNDAFHNPRSCLPAGGWNISEARVVRIPVRRSKEHEIVAARSLLVRQDDATERALVLYWYQTGARTVPTTGKSRLEKLFRRIALGMKHHKEVTETTYFYRLMTPAVDGEDAAYRRLTRFVRDFTLARQKYIQ